MNSRYIIFCILTINLFLLQNITAQCGYQVDTLSIINVSCNGLSDGKVNLLIVGNTPPYYFNGIEGDNNFTLDNLSAGITNIEISDSENCITLLSFEIIEPTTLTVSIDITNYCETSLIEVAASGGTYPYEYKLNNNTPVLTDTAYYIVSADTHQVEIKDINGCIVMETVIITAYDQIEIIIDSIKHSTCLTSADGQIYAHIEGGSPPYQTNSPLFDNNLIIIDNLDRGKYLIEVTDNVNCGNSRDVVLEFIDSVYVDILQENEILYYGKSIELEVDFHASSEVIDFAWSPSTGLDCTTCQNPIASPITDTYYYLDILDENGCYSSDSVKFNIVSNVLFMPNAFSPNNDGINDKFESLGFLEGVSNYSLLVFNRFGQLICESRNPFEGWDGSFNGETCPNGTYIWKLVYEFKEDPHYKGLVSDQGVVTLIR